LSNEVVNGKGKKLIEDLSTYFPSFLWVVRDFSLKLIDDEGNNISSNVT
jgi:hypothetical protein